MIQRPLNQTYNIARHGAAKKLVVPATTHGQKRASTGEPAAYHHGVTTDDRPNTTKTFVGSVLVHSGMTEGQRAKVHPTANDPSVILGEASGRPPEKA